MRDHHPPAPYRLATVPRAAAVAALALLAALAAGCGGDDGQTRTVASDRTDGGEAARPELPPPTPDFRDDTARTRPADGDTAGSDPVPDEVTYDRAASAYRSGDHPRALRLFETYLEREPDDAWGRYMLGLSARKADRPERAEEAFRTVLERDPDHDKSRVNLARTLLDLDRSEEAVETLRPVLRGERPPADALRVAGNAAWETGDTGRARRLYRAAISVNGSDAWSMNNLGLLLIREGRYEEAVGPLARALELRPERAPFRNNLAVALERTGHPALAAEHYRAAAEIGHPKAEASLARVEAHAADSTVTGPDLAGRAHDFAVEAEGWSPTLARESSEPAGEASGGTERTPGDERPDGGEDERRDEDQRGSRDDG